MKVTVVGFWGGYPGKEEATSGYLFEKDGFQLLVDCGSGVLSQVQRYTSLESIDAIIISHYHHDHVADIGPMQFARHVQSFIMDGIQTLPIYGHQMNGEGFSRLSYKTATKGMSYSLEDHLKIGPFQINFIETQHPEPCVAMKISDGVHTIVYTADTSFFEALVSFTSDADCLIAECSLYKDQDGAPMGHMNSHDVGQLAKEAAVKELLITHLPHYGEHNQLIGQVEEIYKGKVSLASSGWTWEGKV